VRVEELRVLLRVVLFLLEFEGRLVVRFLREFERWGRYH
jgi:hypothetical protein